MPDLVIRYRREFDVPLDAAYAWLTDYQDDDPDRTSAVVKKRPVVERGPNRAVLEGELEILGRKSRGRAVVTMHPPDHWVAQFQHGSGQGSVYDYRLTPLGERRCRLDVSYRIHVRRWKRWVGIALARGRIWKELDRMWEGFDQSMRKDLTAQTAAR